ncbi:MAG: YbaB/EbfC family nucleoid-associated protein [Planctomycetota bacterium]
MFKGLGNIAQLLKQANTIGPKMEQINEELKNKRVSGSAGGGMVTVHANGHGHVLSIDVDPVLIEKGDVEMVKDLLPSAINQAVAAAKQLHVESMQSLTGGMQLPGMEDAFKQLAGGLDELQQTDQDDSSDR